MRIRHGTVVLQYGGWCKVDCAYVRIMRGEGVGRTQKRYSEPPLSQSALASWARGGKA